MLRLKRIFKNYEETGSLNERVNLYGFIGPEVFLTKTGDLGLILEVQGVDYECLDRAAIDALTKRPRVRSETLWRRLSRLPISLQTKQPDHPVQTLRQPRRGRGDSRIASPILPARPTRSSPYPSTT